MLSLAASGLIGLCATGVAAAQEKQRVSMKTPAENTKYTQQVFIDVGDAPGHQVRAYENSSHLSEQPAGDQWGEACGKLVPRDLRLC